MGARDQGAEDHRGGAGVIERRVGRRDVEAELGDQPGESRGLAFGKVEHEARQRSGVDDRVLERALEAAADEPGVECVMAVLDEDRAEGKAKEGAARVFEFGRTDEHRAVDVVALARIWVDGSPAIDERVKEGKRAAQAKALGADLEHEEGRIPGGLNVEGHKLGVLEQGLPADLRSVDRDFLPGHEGGRPARLEIERLRAHQRASARARRAQPISSLLRARRSSTNAAYTTAPAMIGIATLNPSRVLSG